MLGTVCEWRLFCQIFKLLYHCEWLHSHWSQLIMGFAFVLNYSVSCLYSNIYFHNVRSLCLVQFGSDSFFVSSSSCCTSPSDHVHTDWIWVKALFLIIMFTHLISQYETLSNGSCCCMLLLPCFSLNCL